jgi:hypothetical protein
MKRTVLAVLFALLVTATVVAKPLTEKETQKLSASLNRAAQMLPQERVATLMKSQILFVTDEDIEDFAKKNKLTKQQVRDLKKLAMFVPQNRAGVLVYVDSQFIRELLAAETDTLQVYALAAMLDHEIEHLRGEDDESRAYEVEIATLKSLIKKFNVVGLDGYLSQLERIAREEREASNKEKSRAARQPAFSFTRGAAKPAFA